MHKVILILDKFFLKYEGRGGGGGQFDPPPQEKLPSKSPTLLGLKPLYFTSSHSFSFVVPLTVIRCQLLSLLALIVIRCHSLSLVVPLVVICCTTRCHSLSLVVPLIVTRFHLMYHSSVFLQKIKLNWQCISGLTQLAYDENQTCVYLTL